MKQVKMIDRQDARKIIEGIIYYVNKIEPLNKGHNLDPGETAPVVVTVVNPFGAEKRQDVMDGALGISSKRMAEDKANTAADTGEDGDYWDLEEGTVPKAYDPRYPPTSGGVVLRDPDTGVEVGAVGISGRAPERDNGEHHPLQDHELALLAREIFIEYTKACQKDDFLEFKFTEDLYAKLRERLEI